MILYFSGESWSFGYPEIILGDKACIMMSFGRFKRSRFKKIYKKRKQAKRLAKR